jgi:hypothetical protein
MHKLVGLTYSAPTVSRVDVDFLLISDFFLSLEWRLYLVVFYDYVTDQPTINIAEQVFETQRTRFNIIINDVMVSSSDKLLTTL